MNFGLSSPLKANFERVNWVVDSLDVLRVTLGTVLANFVGRALEKGSLTVVVEASLDKVSNSLGAKQSKRDVCLLVLVLYQYTIVA